MTLVATGVDACREAHNLLHRPARIVAWYNIENHPHAACIPQDQLAIQSQPQPTPVRLHVPCTRQCGARLPFLATCTLMPCDNSRTLLSHDQAASRQSLYIYNCPTHWSYIARSHILAPPSYSGPRNTPNFLHHHVHDLVLADDERAVSASKTTRAPGPSAHGGFAYASRPRSHAASYSSASYITHTEFRC